MKIIKTTWTGIRPLLMSNAQMVDPLHPLVRWMNECNRKKGKDRTDADRELMQRIEWEGALYWDKDMGLFMPSDNIERCIREGAAKSRMGKNAEAGSFVTEAMVPVKGLSYPKDLDKLFLEERFKFRKPVRIPPKTGARVMKVRPIIPTGWKLEFNLEFDDTVLNAKDLTKAMDDAGALVGLGNWRPKFGRFTVMSVV